MDFSRSGAVDLSGLTGDDARPGPDGTGAGGRWSYDVTDKNFTDEVINASMRHIVVLTLWSPRSAASAEVTAVLADVADDFEGRIAVAKVDVDANPAIAQALGAQAVPFVVALLRGQPVPLFERTAEADEVRHVYDQLVTAAVQSGVSGRAEPRGVPSASAEEAPADPRFAAADAALDAGDIDAAVAEYERLLIETPGDPAVAGRLAGANLLARARGADLQVARTAAAEAPNDIDAQLLVADLDLSGGHVDDAFARLIDLVRRTHGDDRETVRTRLLELFTVVGSADPRVATARRALASALF